MAKIQVEDWQAFVDGFVRRSGPHAAEALNRFRARIRNIVRGVAARGVSVALMRVCVRPVVGMTYIQLLQSLGISPEPPTPDFIEKLIDDALR